MARTGLFVHLVNNGCNVDRKRNSSPSAGMRAMRIKEITKSDGLGMRRNASVSLAA